jgi:hypothetical protein
MFPGFRKQKTEQIENANFRCMLQMENENGKLPFV